MSRRHQSLAVSATLALTLAAACTDRQLVPVEGEQPKVVDDLIDIDAEFCTRPVADVTFPVKLILVVDTHGPVDEHAPAPSPARPSSNSPASRTAPPRPEEEDIDLTDLVDAPPGVMKSPEDRLAEAFPGSVFVDEQR